MSEVKIIKKDVEFKQKWLKEIENLEDVIRYTKRARCYVGYEEHEYLIGDMEYKTHISDELKNSIHELAKEKLNQLTEDGYEKWLEKQEKQNETK